MHRNKSFTYAHLLRVIVGLNLAFLASSFLLPTNHKQRVSSPQCFFSSQIKIAKKLLPTVLLSKKAKDATSTKKIQVKMLKYVAGTGIIGDIVQVTPAFFNNMLRPSKSAVIISDDEIQREIAETEAQEKIRNEKATELKMELENLVLELKRKAGPDGHLFGSICPKNIVEEVNMKINNHHDFLKEKGVKIASIVDENGNELKGDIKHTGEFTATFSLAKTISAKLVIRVQTEG